MTVFTTPSHRASPIQSNAIAMGLLVATLGLSACGQSNDESVIRGKLNVNQSAVTEQPSDEALTTGENQTLELPQNVDLFGEEDDLSIDGAEGSLLPDAEGSLSTAAEGSLLTDAEGSLSNDAEGSLSTTAEGSLSTDAKGSLGDVEDEGSAQGADDALISDTEDSLKALDDQPSSTVGSNERKADASPETAPDARDDLVAGRPTEERFCLDSVEALTQQERIADDCLAISNRLASVSLESCESAKLQATGCASNAGFPMYVTEFPPLPTREPQGRIMVIGGTHGDELTSVSVVFRWIEKLNQFHSGLYHWRIAPLMNPDGVLPREATRVNGNGVDLNRNMPSRDWHEKAILYWQDRTDSDPRKNPGPSPASEVESQWLIDEINAFAPDAIISVHAPYGIVDFDALELNTAPKSLGKLRLNMLGTYPGSLGNFAGIDRNIPVITLELPHAWVIPSPEESTKIWEDIVAWLKVNVDTRENAAQE